MKKISVYFRDEKDGWEMQNLSFEPGVFNQECWRKLIEIGCNYSIFGNASISKDIDNFLSDKSVKEFSFDANGGGRYYYIMRREEV
jgi:hypothetical protein